MKHKKALSFLCAGGLCVVAALLSLCLGAANLTVAQLGQAIANGPKNTAGYIFYYVRLPRTAACLLSGAALSVSGAVIQGVLHNKLASPGIIGVNAGAGLAVTLCCAFAAMSGWVIAVSSFVGAMLSVLLVMFTSEKTGASRTSDNRIIMPMSALLGAVYIMWADAFARSSFGAVELPIGIVTAFIGAPFFMYLMIRSGYGGSKE